MTLVIGFLIPLLGTMLGSAFVFLMKDEMSARVQKSLLGFASGVMVAASPSRMFPKEPLSPCLCVLQETAGGVRS